MAFPKIEGYVVTERLGSGSYSTVYKAYTKVGARTMVAIKCIDKSRIKHSGSAVDNLVTEIRLLKKLTHPHIVHMKEFTWDDRNIYIIMEYCCGGDLSKYIQRYGRVQEKQVLRFFINTVWTLLNCVTTGNVQSQLLADMFQPHPEVFVTTSCVRVDRPEEDLVLYFLQQLASALKFLREKGVVHMDLKPHNLLLHKGSDGKYILKVADFGFAQHMSQEWSRSVRGSPLYMAPEMFAGEYDARVDLWSVGVIMYECLFGRAPYSSSTFKELIDKIQKKAPIELPRHSSISPGCRDLLLRLLQHDPDRRISYEDFFSHEYLDLEHMPSRENYEKAVSLIKQAIELDSLGQLPHAFAAYRDALRYLVPAVSAETDTLRRQALTAKLARYMERAEEIKLYLKHGEAGPPVPTGDNGPAAEQRVPQSCNTSCNPCGCVQRSVEGVCACDVTAPGVSNGINGEGIAREEQPVPIPEPSPPAPSAPDRSRKRSDSRSNTPTRFTFRKLFGRQATIPYLNKEDSSITQEETEKGKTPTGEPANEGCRIT